MKRMRCRKLCIRLQYYYTCLIAISDITLTTLVPTDVGLLFMAFSFWMQMSDDWCINYLPTRTNWLFASTRIIQVVLCLTMIPFMFKTEISVIEQDKVLRNKSCRTQRCCLGLKYVEGFAKKKINVFKRNKNIFVCAICIT